MAFVIQNTFSEGTKYTISVVKISKIVEKFPQIPTFQRLLNIYRVNEIYNNMLEYSKKYGGFLAISQLVFAKTSSKYWVLDGMHRLEVYKKLLSEQKVDLDVVCAEINVKDESEARYHFNIINNVIPLPDMPEGINIDTVKEVSGYFFERYPEIFRATPSGRCQRPHININAFQEEVAKLLTRITGTTPTDIIRKIEDINSHKMSEYMTYHFDLFNKARTKGGFYLGIETGFEWLYDAYNLETTRAAKPKKKTIPQTLRISVWNNHIGHDKREGQCVACKSHIKMENFHCGHIVAEARGGKTELSNLIPLCTTCNLSMGTMNAHEFIETYLN